MHVLLTNLLPKTLSKGRKYSSRTLSARSAARRHPSRGGEPQLRTHAPRGVRAGVMGTPPFSRTAVIVLMRVSNDSSYFVSTKAKLAWVVIMTDAGRERRSLLGRGPFVLENLASWPIRWPRGRSDGHAIGP